MAAARVLLASTGFAVTMELVAVPCFNYLLKDSTHWSASTFVGALLFLVACSNLLYCADLRCLTWCAICRAVIDLIKFTSPWLLYRIIWIPITRKVFRSLIVDYHLSACQASSRLSYLSLTFGSIVLLMSALYNRQLPLHWITYWLCCGGCRRAPGCCACPRLIEVDIIQHQGNGRVLDRIEVIARDPGYLVQMFKHRH